MPYFAKDHISRVLTYLPDHTHPSLVSFLGMLKAEVPVSASPSKVFGSPQETQLMRMYFHPDGGPQDRPWYVPFGPEKEGGTNWKPKEYAGKSLQRMRTGKSFIYLQGGGASNDLWAFHPDLLKILAERGNEVIGILPLSIHNLAVWCYRLEDVASHKDAINKFIDEFRLNTYKLVGNAFEASLDPALVEISFESKPLSSSSLLNLLQSPPSPAATTSTATTNIRVDTNELDDEEQDADYTWEVDAENVTRALGELRGMEEAAFRALSALRAGMHVIFTGPPGTGKTQVARRLCNASGIPFFMVAATDQWTTVDTIGGYFPSASVSGKLDFLPGFVVNALMRKRALIIDEINRADIDKAFGELFTLLSGHDVDLPYLVQSNVNGKEVSRRLRLATSGAEIDSEMETVLLPSWWRLIGSMNDADKASLKRLSYAFVRRFAFIPVQIPSNEIYQELLDTGAGSGESGLAFTRPEYLSSLKALFADPAGLVSIDMAMGYAIPEAMMRQARSEIAINPERTTPDLLVSTLDLYVAPQFQGRADKHDELLVLLSKHLKERELQEFSQRLAVWTGFLE